MANLAVRAPRPRVRQPQGRGGVRYYLGVDWADQTHAVWVVEADGTKIAAHTVPHTAEGLSECWRPRASAWRHRAGYTGRRVEGATVSGWRWPIVAASVLLVPDVALFLGPPLNMW